MTDQPATNPNDHAIWSCKIGWTPRACLPDGSDAPMRQAVAHAYKQLTGFDDEFIFSGWGGQLDEGELAVVEDREPVRELTEFGKREALDDLLYRAWAVIANASNWLADDSQSSEWVGAAIRWRDDYHATLPVALSEEADRV